MKKVFCVTLIILFFCLTMIPIGCRTTENEHALSDGSSESVDKEEPVGTLPSETQPGDSSESEDDEEQVKEKSVLIIGVSDINLGYSWVEKLAETFEEYYKDTEFETGKKGHGGVVVI